MNKKATLLATAALTTGLILFLKAKKRLFPSAKVVTGFDLSRFMGKWYEIARLDYRYEQDLDHCTSRYTRNKDGSIKVVNQGYNFNTGEFEQVKGRARLNGRPGEGRLRVSFWGPFYAAFNIIGIDPEYRYALVAGRNRNYLWFLSRRKTMTQKVKKEFLNVAEQAGFNTDQLIWVSHEPFETKEA